MSELGTPHRGTTTTPGDPVYNFITLAAIYFNMSTMQLEAEMRGDWGTESKELDNIVNQLRRRQQFDILFAQRATWSDADEQQVYQGAGLVQQLQDYVLNAGSSGNTLSWKNLNDFIEPMFESSLSAMEKNAFFGSALFRDALNVARDVGRVMLIEGRETYYEPELGSNACTLSTDSGKRVVVREEKWAFGGKLSDWGIVLDSNNMGAGQYRGMGEQVFANIQAPREITTLSHAVLTSWGVNVYDDSTMGVVRGGTKGLINR